MYEAKYVGIYPIFILFLLYDMDYFGRMGLNIELYSSIIDFPAHMLGENVILKKC